MKGGMKPGKKFTAWVGLQRFTGKHRTGEQRRVDGSSFQVGVKSNSKHVNIIVLEIFI